MKKKMETKKEEIRKGPWKEEEDEVLLNHVNRYGPRDWSSIRSKGLLQRTGKSCRLRWVNKLRPNLKNGCKFSVEEERIVIELQAEFGNKWARIATYLQGRTDNDVKNFWSSRQKRHARILQNSSGCDADASSSSFNLKDSSSQRVKFKPLRQDFGLVEQQEITASSSSSSSKKIPYTSNDQVELNFKLNHQPFSFGTDLVLTETTTNSLFSDTQQENIPFSPESMELLARLDDPNFYDILGPPDSSDEPLFTLPQPFFEPSPPVRRFRHDGGFLDDFPTDLFDQVDDDPVRSP